MQSLPRALEGFGRFQQFILYDRQTKLPIDYRTNTPGDPLDASAWLTFPLAVQWAEYYGNTRGIGFVFTDQDPYFFLDIDSCATPGGWSETAVTLLRALPGAAVEVSMSGRGLHVYGVCHNPPSHKCKNTQLGIELYTSKRYVALTGAQTLGSVDTDLSTALPALISTYFRPDDNATAPAAWTNAPATGYAGPQDDAELISRALASKSARSIFGQRVTFRALWTADTDALGKRFPDQSGARAYDASSADAALAQHLAFWTGRDCERMLRLMRQSALVREKWDREDYLHRTIIGACARQTTVYAKREAAPVPRETVAPVVVSGYQYLSADAQIQHFRGCVYVQDAHRAFTPSGLLLRPEQFNSTFGGYIFQLDESGDKITRRAWEAFTESQIVRYPIAQSTCFRPELAPGAIVTEESQSLVNTYVPIDTPRLAGDPAPFLDHMRRLLPDAHDREILMAYMAACVQHKGVKFQWAPLIQGVEGNGKTLLTRCVAFAIGSRYTHMPPAMEITEKFNSWLFRKCFIGIEDVYVANEKREVLEILKPMITNDRLACREMQQAQIMGDNRANFMLNSNHKDAIRKTANDRRFCVFYTAQQDAADLKRDGMSGEYFPSLYTWLRGKGYAIVSEYLHTYSIPDALNPAIGCHRAPDTSSTHEAIVSSMGTVEQEILEAIEESRAGFAGGWVSSVAVDALLRVNRRDRVIPPNRRRELMLSLGYDWHPALRGGRVNSASMLDGGKKPRLFVRAGSLQAQLTDPAVILRCYTEAQQLGGNAGLNTSQSRCG